MAIGSAIASVAGGAMKMSAANKQAKAGERAAGMADDQMAMQQENMQKAIAAWEDQMGYAKGFQSMLEGLGQEYGDLASDMWQNWENTFGGMEQNLVDYYNNLDPTKFSVQAKAEIGKQMQKASEQFNQVAAQSGIYTSGMKLQNQKENQFKQAQAFAQADLAAPEHVMGMKNQFYGNYGAPQKVAAQNMQANALAQQGNFANMGYNALQNVTQGMSNAYMGQAGYNTQNANTYAKSAAGYGSAAGQNMGQGMNMIGSGLTDLFGGM